MIAFNEKIRDEVVLLLDNPDDILQQKPFIRGIDGLPMSDRKRSAITINTTDRVKLPKTKYIVVTQEDYLRELHPESHKVMYDENIPKITQKLANGKGYVELEFKRLSLPYQRRILAKDVLHLCGNKTEHTLINENPTKSDQSNTIMFKQYWRKRDQDGMRTAAIRTQKSLGVVGWLFFHNYKGEIKSRILSYEDGYIVCCHKDKDGEELLNAVYYADIEGNERIDAYDDKYMYSFTNKQPDEVEASENGWYLLNEPSEHGFSECPLIIERGSVAWDDAQTIIEVYEILYNIFTVIMKRHGWGILYVKGQFDSKVKQLAGSVILQDTSIDGQGDANYKTPPNPEGMFNMLESLKDEIQIAASCTFILPKDVSISGDVSGLAIQLTQSGDNEKAIEGSIQWSDSINKATRLFKEGLSKELVQKKINTNAVLEFSKLDFSAKIIPWMPKSTTELMQTINTMKGAGILSQETGIEIGQGIGIGAPDEKVRIKKDEDREDERVKTQKTETIDVNNAS